MPGKIGNYHWYDLGELDLNDVLKDLGDDLNGLRAVNTAFDSGRYEVQRKDSRSGWQVVNGHAVSPPITHSMLGAWPVSHESYCDEWWLFSSVPEDFSCSNAFCNYVGMRIKDWHDLEFESGCMLLRNLERYSPLFILGNNEWTYLISHKDIPRYGLTTG